VCTGSGALLDDAFAQPALISDGAGGAIIAWPDRRSGTDLDIYAQRLDANGAPLWAGNGIPLCVALGDQAEVTLVSDGAGGAILAWWDLRDFVGNIYVQRLDGNGNAMWAANGIPICSSDGIQTQPMLVTTFTHQAIVSWADKRNGNDYDIYADRTIATSVLDVPLARTPGAFQVSLASSNPAHGMVRLAVTLAQASAVDAKVFDLQGREVRSLVSAQSFEPGSHTLARDGRTDSGALAGAGLYLVRIRAGSDAREVRVIELR
jgi:hypothetical protein